MEHFEAFPKKRGNSIWITIPPEIVEREGIRARKKITVLISSGGSGVEFVK